MRTEINVSKFRKKGFNYVEGTPGLRGNEYLLGTYFRSFPFFGGVVYDIFRFPKVTLGEGNGTPLQYSCLENAMDGGAWKAAVHGVAEGQI